MKKDLVSKQMMKVSVASPLLVLLLPDLLEARMVAMVVLQVVLELLVVLVPK